MLLVRFECFEQEELIFNELMNQLGKIKYPQRKREFLAESKEREDYIKVNEEREITVASEEESLRIKKIKGQKKYCKALDEQIRSQNVRLVDTENMTEVEKSINRKESFLNRFVPLYIIGVSFSYFYGISMYALERIESDPILKKKVYKHLKIKARMF